MARHRRKMVLLPLLCVSFHPVWVKSCCPCIMMRVWEPLMPAIFTTSLNLMFNAESDTLEITNKRGQDLFQWYSETIWSSQWSKTHPHLWVRPECLSIEKVPSFQTLKFNVQTNRSQPVIYGLELQLYIQVRHELLSASQRATLQQDILVPAQARRPDLWDKPGAPELHQGVYSSLSEVWLYLLLTNTCCSNTFSQIVTHIFSQWLTLSLTC